MEKKDKADTFFTCNVCQRIFRRKYNLLDIVKIVNPYPGAVCLIVRNVMQGLPEMIITNGI